MRITHKKNALYVIICLFFLSFIAVRDESKIVTEDVLRALKISGIEFSEDQIATMLPYLERNKKGYQEMRAMKLSINSSPSVAFKLPVKEKINLVFNLHSDPVKLPKKDSDIAFLSVGQLAYLIQSKKISSVQLTKIYLERINQFNKKVNAVVTLTDSLALAQAAQADKEIQEGKYRGLLHGIPYGVKDLASYPMYPTTWGAMPLKNQVINDKAVVIEKLENAGAVMLAKLSSGALARGDVWYGGKTLNPWDLSQGSSGSSAGSASATSAGLVGFSIGTETLGSIVSPSTRCGVTGLRPTFNSVSTEGFMTLSWSMDKVGPITRTAKGAAIVFNEIKRRDTTLDNRTVDFAEEDLPLKIGFLETLFLTDTSRYSKNNLETINILQKEYKLTPLELPTKYPFSVFDIILRSEAGAFFDDFLLNHLDSSMVQQGERSRANSIRQSRLIPAVEYIQANRHRAILIEEMNELFSEFDVIVAPSFGKNQLLITNLTGHPVVTIPNGFDKDNRPTSITFIANYYNEDKILYLADKIQKETHFHQIPPPYFD